MIRRPQTQDEVNDAFQAIRYLLQFDKGLPTHYKIVGWDPDDRVLVVNHVCNHTHTLRKSLFSPDREKQIWEYKGDLLT